MKQPVSSLRQWMLEQYAPQFHLEKKTLLKQLDQVGFYAERCLPPVGQRVSCQLVLNTCRLYLQTLCPEPPEGWLAFLYEEICQKMFPETGHSPMTPGQRQAAVFYLGLLRYAISRENCPFDPLTDLDAVTEAELQQSRITKEYTRFWKAVEDDYFIELMRIGREIMPFDPASHTIGVHHVAVHMARQALQAGIPVDIALCSAAALSHDIGKFGCRGRDARRIPYLHYYFTWQWLEGHGVPTIANIAANHSTWDLEFENLPGESLLLIYADFRVRGNRDAEGRERVQIFSLEAAYQEIFRKLADMTPEKQLRYRTVYAKLHDFEQYLLSHGVDPDPVQRGACTACTPKAALLPRREIPRQICNLTFHNNIRLMRQITHDASFEQLLEQARNEKNLQSVRTYLHLYSEYHTYLTRAQKQKLLAFLYELLMHHDGDVRRRAARMMGQVLTNSGPKYRKKLPAGVPPQAAAPNLLSFLNESVQIWASYAEQCLHPDQKIAPKHALRISNSLKIVAESIFRHLSCEKWPEYLEVLLAQVRRDLPQDRFVLLDTLNHVPDAAFTPQQCQALLAQFASHLSGAAEREQIAALRFFRKLLTIGDEALQVEVRRVAQGLEPGESYAVGYERSVLLRGAGETASLRNAERQHLYLSNMKMAVHWSVKISHIDMLCENVTAHPEMAFHTAMHLSNLLCVSEHLPVRDYAGEHLVALCAKLPADQQNELMIDLIRELETGREEVSRYIPKFLGRMLCQLPDSAFDECLQSLAELVHSDNTLAAMAALTTLAVVLANQAGSEAVTEQVFGLLLTGVAHFDDMIHQRALSLICRQVFDNPSLPLSVRQRYFIRICKKFLTLLEEPHPGQLNFFTCAAALNHLYRFLVQCQVHLPEPVLPPERPIAFFPGTFDPFSSGHKRIVQEICAKQFDVYLAVDEFSWSKQTLAKLLRRQIASISVADQLDVYLFPDDIPINIAMAEDLARLRQLLPNQAVYLAVGSDVVRNASAYRPGATGGAADFDHIVFSREETDQLPPLETVIRGKLEVLQLPPFFDSVSSSRIREYVDKNLDISMLVDPIVQNFIYRRGLYLRTLQYKMVLQPHKLYFENAQEILPEIPQKLAEKLAGWPGVASCVLRSRATGGLWGWACGRTVQSYQLLDVLQDAQAASCVRERVSGNILLIDGVGAVAPGQSVERQALNELLARAQERSITYAICRCPAAGPLEQALRELGFAPTPEQPSVWVVDMRRPVVLILDALQKLKAPHRENPKVIRAVEKARRALRLSFAQMFPGDLILSFDVELLNQALRSRVQCCNGVANVPPGERRLGRKMCVPFGKILANDLVPNTVTKRLEVEKVFLPNIRGLEIKEYPGYSTLINQVRTIKSFRRPMILVDDLMHNGYRMEYLTPLLRQEQVEIDRLIVGIMSGRGKDRMRLQNIETECEYFIPAMRYWQTESLLYPFIGGDSVLTSRKTEMLPTINLILPYKYPHFFSGVPKRAIYALSETVLASTQEILRVLEKEHLSYFGKSLTLKRLGEAVFRPRMPDRGGHLSYDLNIPASVYVQDDINTLHRMQGWEETP